MSKPTIKADRTALNAAQAAEKIASAAWADQLFPSGALKDAVAEARALVAVEAKAYDAAKSAAVRANRKPLK